MPLWFWLMIAALAVAAAVVAWCLTTKKKPTVCVTRPSTQLPNVCSVWNRWRLLLQPEQYSGKRRFGLAWRGDTCPAGALLQRLNRSDVACVEPRDRTAATELICRHHVSSDALAVPVSPSSSDETTDHWVQLKHAMRLEVTSPQGDGWQEGGTCPSGAFFQLMADGEAWCVLPERAAKHATTDQQQATATEV